MPTEAMSAEFTQLGSNITKLMAKLPQSWILTKLRQG